MCAAATGWFCLWVTADWVCQPCWFSAGLGRINAQTSAFFSPLLLLFLFFFLRNRQARWRRSACAAIVKAGIIHPSIHLRCAAASKEGGIFFSFFLLFFSFILFFFQGSAGWIQVKRKAYSELLGMCGKEPAGVPKKNVVVFLLFIYFSAFLAWNKKREPSRAAFSRSCIFLQQDYSSTSPVTLQSGRSGELFWRKYDCKDTNKGKEDGIKKLYFFTYIYRFEPSGPLSNCI